MARRHLGHDHARPGHAARRRDGGPRDARRGRRPLCSTGRGRSRDRRDPRDGRRHGLRDPAVQRRRAGTAPARLVLQAVRATRPRSSKVSPPRRPIPQPPASLTLAQRADLEGHRAARAAAACGCARPWRSPSTRCGPSSSSMSAPDEVVATVERLGIHEGITPVPAIALGGLEEGVSPLEMASAYGVFANEGTLRRALRDQRGLGRRGRRALQRATRRRPRSWNRRSPGSRPTCSRASSRSGTGTAAAIGRPAAGKTGTTQEYRDAWFVGYTPQVSAAVWVGYPEEQREMKDVHGRRVTGGSFPAEIWAAFMKAAHARVRRQRTGPSRMGSTTVACCTQTGLKATEYCPETFSATFLTGPRARRAARSTRRRRRSRCPTSSA